MRTKLGDTEAQKTQKHVWLLLERSWDFYKFFHGVKVILQLSCGVTLLLTVRNKIVIWKT